MLKKLNYVRTRLKIYIGFKENKKPEIFKTEAKAVKETRTEYDFIHGPFESAEKAHKYVNALGGLVCGDG